MKLSIASVFLAISLLFISPNCSAQATPIPSCMPTIYGDNQGSPGVFYTWMGWYGYFYCKTPDPADKTRYLMIGHSWACVASDCNPILLATNYIKVKMAGLIGLQTSSAQGYWSQYVVGSCVGSTGDFATLCQAAKYTMCVNFPNTIKPDSCSGVTMPVIPPSPPPPPVVGFIVAPTSICSVQDKNSEGICITRQSFTWDGTTRGNIAQPERASIGAPCDPSKGPAPYFVFDQSRTDRVVQCVKK